MSNYSIIARIISMNIVQLAKDNQLTVALLEDLDQTGHLNLYLLDNDDKSALYYAIFHNNNDAAKWMIKKDANMTRQKHASSPPIALLSKQMRYLDLAASKNNVELIQCLLTHSYT